MDEPIDLATAKLQCRVIDDTSEDALIEGFIVAAREWVESVTGHALVQRQFVERRDNFETYIELTRRPVILNTVLVDYVDGDGAPQAYSDFVAQVDREPARIYPAIGGEWPTLSDYGGVTVTYDAGYELGEEPKPLIQAMLLLIAHWYKNREAVTANQPFTVPLAVEALCAPYWTPVL